MANNSSKGRVASPPAPSAQLATPQKRAAPGERDAQFRAALPTFLEELAGCGSVTAAAKVACIDRVWAYKHAERDPDFAIAFSEAKLLGGLALEDEARRRATGYLEPVVFKGELMTHLDEATGEMVPTTIRKHSDTLLIFLLKGAFPEKYRERSSIDVGGDAVMGPAMDFSQLSVEELRLLHELHRKATTADVIDVEAEEVTEGGPEAL